MTQREYEFCSFDKIEMTEMYKIYFESFQMNKTDMLWMVILRHSESFELKKAKLFQYTSCVLPLVPVLVLTQ